MDGKKIRKGAEMLDIESVARRKWGRRWGIGMMLVVVIILYLYAMLGQRSALGLGLGYHETTSGRWGIDIRHRVCICLGSESSDSNSTIWARGRASQSRSHYSTATVSLLTSLIFSMTTLIDTRGVMRDTSDSLGGSVEAMSRRSLLETE